MRLDRPKGPSKLACGRPSGWTGIRKHPRPYGRGCTHFIYSLTPPAEILLMMYLEQNANTIRIGITEMATAR